MAKQAIYQWQVKEQPSQEQIAQFREQTGTSAVLATLCLQRGISTKEQFEQFRAPDLSQLHDPYLLYDMQKAVERIKRAIEEGQRILVYGDYDADGITSTTILAEAIDQLGGDVHYYLPNRFIDGYGPNKDVFAYMIDVEKTQLIVTCDNGVAGHEAIAYATAKSIDVIVTDHHELPEALPNAYAIVHPRHPKGTYPFGELSGAGVAFKVATALLGELPYDMLDVVAIGTIADLVPLQDENRVLVKHGITALKQTQRLGLVKLFDRLDVDMATLDEESIGFVLGPRLNAIGRMDDANPGVSLLMTFDEEEADEIIDYIQEKNDERKAVVEQITQEALQQLQEPYPNVIVLSHASWHAGVLGIVASKIVEQTGKPTILLQEDVQTGIAKGSARSVTGVNLYQVLTKQAQYLDKFGGHEMAAGLSLKIDNIKDLAIALQNETDQQSVVPLLLVDSMIDASVCQTDLVHELKQLAPFGTANAKPVFQIEQVQINQAKRIGAKQQHFKASTNQFDILQFYATHIADILRDGVYASLVGELRLNTWNGLERVQMQLLDAKIDGVQLFDKRANRIAKDSCQLEHALYLVSTQHSFDTLKTLLPATSQVMFYQDAVAQQCDTLVLFDCPANVIDGEQAVLANQFDNIYIVCHVAKSAYLIGEPTREQFAMLYKILYKTKKMNIRDKLTALAQYMKIKKDLLILMIQVFSEAKFVKITDGVLEVNETQSGVKLEDTQVLQQHLSKIQAEKQYVYCSFVELEQRLKGYMEKKEE